MILPGMNPGGWVIHGYGPDGLEIELLGPDPAGVEAVAADHAGRGWWRWEAYDGDSGELCAVWSAV